MLKANFGKFSEASVKLYGSLQITFVTRDFMHDFSFLFKFYLVIKWKVYTCNVQIWANQRVQRVVLYIRDDTTHYGGSSLTLKDQRGLLPEIFNLLLVGILYKSVIGQYFLKKEVIQFWSYLCRCYFHIFGISHHTQWFFTNSAAKNQWRF